MTMRDALIPALLGMALLVGCGTKPQDVGIDKKSALPQIPTAQKKSVDVFDEFYSEDTANSGVKNVGSGKETFTTKAKTESVKKQPVAAVSHTPVKLSSTGRYVVQVSTVGSKALADHNAKKLVEKGYPAYVSEVQNPTPSLSGTYYRIRIGGFDAITAAKEFGESLKGLGYDYWVDKKSNDNVGMEGYGLGTAPTGADGYVPYSSTSSSGWESSPAAEPAPSTVPTTSPASEAAPTPPAPVASEPPPPAELTGQDSGSSGSTWGKDDWGSSSGGW